MMPLMGIQTHTGILTEEIKINASKNRLYI